MTRAVDGAVPGVSRQEQRLSTQLDRHRWDAEWIAGQRSATDVVRGGHREGAPDTAGSRATASKPEASEARESPQALGKQRPIAGDNTSACERGVESLQRGDRAPAQEAVLTEPSPWATSSTAAWPAPGARADIANAFATENVLPNLGDGATGTRPTLNPLSVRHFALWRNDDTVRAAMRLRDPEQQASSVIATLRSWLRDAGLTLTRVLVNGHSSQSDPKK